MGRDVLDNSSNLQRRIAIEAARLIAEQGMRDYHAAKLKAASRLGLSGSAPLPRNSDIDAALREHQRLFQSRSQPRQLARLRETAVEAMRFFAAFEPRLVGAVLDGSADEFSAVCLHLFTDNLREITDLLADSAIAHEQQDRRMRLGAGIEIEVPAIVFAADGITIDVSVFAVDGLRQAPLDRISERPMRRATLTSLTDLIAQFGQASDAESSR